MINIARNYRGFSSEELRDKAYMGSLECNGYDLSDFLEYIFQDMISQDELDKAVEDAEEHARSNGSDWCSECEAELN
jgi:hypothetical protein